MGVKQLHFEMKTDFVLTPNTFRPCAYTSGLIYSLYFLNKEEIEYFYELKKVAKITETFSRN
jgi:hypothetical protein